MTDEEKNIIVCEVLESLESRLIERGDERYVMAKDCNDRQEKFNGRLANDDKRIEIIFHDFKIIKWLLTALAGASGGSLITAIIELLSK